MSKIITGALRCFLLLTSTVFWLPMNNAMAGEIRVLSAGAVEPGIVKVIDVFRRKTGHDVKINFATAPAITKRAGAGETVDIVIAPPAVLDEWVKAGKAAQAEPSTTARMGVGLRVRPGAPLQKMAIV